MRYNDPVPSQVEFMYKKGLTYLAKKQNEQGYWNESYGSMAGVVGLCVLAFLAHGEDPNHGPYAKNIKKGIVQA